MELSVPRIQSQRNGDMHIINFFIVRGNYRTPLNMRLQELSLQANQTFPFALTSF